MNQLKSIDDASKRLDDIRSDGLEMAQLKSDFDIEKFTVKREGSFIAHNFHFLMRQYTLALYELRRMLIERETHLRDIKELQALDSSKTDNGEYVDLKILRHRNEIELLDLSLVNKRAMCLKFEQCRLKLIELNEGKSPTNKQYQEEEPKYWKWFLQRKAIFQARQASTGIHEGIWENIEHLEQPGLLTDEFQVLMLDEMMNEDCSKLDLTQIQRRVETQKRNPRVSRHYTQELANE